MSGQRFEIYQDSSQEYRWRFKASNGAIVAVSSEGYVREFDARNGIRLLIDNCGCPQVLTEAQIDAVPQPFDASAALGVMPAEAQAVKAKRKLTKNRALTKAKKRK